MVSYTYLNKSYPKYLYLLPSIDRLVDGASGFPIVGFLNAYSEYNQISMFKQDEEKTMFMIDVTNYCYLVLRMSGQLIRG